MKRVNARGIRQANKHVLMAALAYNLKKYMKFRRKKVKTKALEQPKVQKCFAGHLPRFTAPQASKLLIPLFKIKG